jgi:hypothetical protein
LPVLSGGQAYFITSSGDDDTSTSALWRTDGSRAGTAPVSRAGPANVVAADDGIYFAAGDGSDGERSCAWSSCHLWFLRTGPGPLGEPLATSPPVESAPSLSPPPAHGELAAAFPRDVDGQPLSVRERQGPAWIASYDADDPDDAAAITAIEGFVDSLDRGIDDLTVAWALVPVRGRPAAITAIRVTGAESGDLVDAVIPFLFADTVTPARTLKMYAGKRVIRVTDAANPGSYPRYIYPDRDTLWLVEADEHYLEGIFGALP